MRFPLCLFVLISLVCTSSVAGAAMVRVGPDPCPAPAEASAYRPEEDVQAEAIGPVWRFDQSLAIFYDVGLQHGRRADLFGRIILDPETGLPLGAAYMPDQCGANGSSGEIGAE